jgi:hypothetical protein
MKLQIEYQNNLSNQDFAIIQETSKSLNIFKPKNLEEVISALYVVTLHTDLSLYGKAGSHVWVSDDTGKRIAIITE